VSSGALHYRSAGVDISASDETKARIAKLVSATAIHQAARESADKLRVEGHALLTEAKAEAAAVVAEARGAAERDAGELRAEAQARAASIRAEAEAYATKLTSDAEDYTDATLSDLAQRLQKAASTAEQGRAALARRRRDRGGSPSRNGSDPHRQEPATISG